MKFAGGLLYTRNSNNLQYVAAASDIMIVYANILADAKISSIELTVFPLPIQIFEALQKAR